MANQQPTDPRLEAELSKRRQLAQQQAVQQQQIHYLLRVPPGHEIRPIRSVAKETLVIAVAIIIAGALIASAILIPAVFASPNGDAYVGELTASTPLLPEDNSVVHDDEVTLYWTPVPGAESYTLVVIGGSSSFYLNTSTERTYYTLSGLTNGEAYWWEVAAVKDGRYGPFCPYWLFRVTTMLDAPSLPSPESGGVLSAEAPVLRWASVSGAEEYRLQLSDGPDYSVLLLDVLTPSNQYNINVRMQDGITYYWRVMAHEGSIWSDWSGSYSFVWDVNVPVPSPTGPSQTATAIKGSTNLTWSSVEGADSYNVQVSNTSSFSFLVVNTTVEETKYQLTSSIQDNATYYWRVQAERDGDRSAWSSIWQFYLGHSSFPISFSWDYGGVSWTLTETIPGSDYYFYHDQARNYDYASYVTDDRWVEAIAAKLDQMADSRGYSIHQKAEFVLKFVQSIPYMYDIESTGQEEYPRYSVETLVDHVGDCEDVAVLYASLMQASSINIDTVLLMFTKPGETGHMAVGVAGVGLSGWFFIHGERTYYYCETTNSSYGIGDYPASVLNGFTCTVLPC